MIAWVGIVSVVEPASATLGTNDYPSNLALVPQDSVIDSWSFYNRECTSFVAWRLNHDNGLAFTNNMSGGHYGNAYEWKDNAVALYGSSVYNGTPAKGAVAWWDAYHGGAYGTGHVAYVDSVNANGSINIEEYNFSVTGGYSQRTIQSGSTNWPDGFLHLKDIVANPPAPAYTGITAMSSQIASDGSQHVYSGDAQGNIRETWWSPTSGGVSNNVIAGVGSPITAMSSRYFTSDNSQHIYYGTADGKVRETWWSPTSGGVSTNLLASPGSAVNALSSQVTSDGLQHVYYGTQAGKVYEAWFGGGNSVHVNLLVTRGSAVNAVSDQVAADGSIHIYSGTTDGKVYETWWSPTSGGVQDNLLWSSASQVNAMSSQIPSDGTQHIYVGEKNGNVYEVWFGNGNPVNINLLLNT